MRIAFALLVCLLAAQPSVKPDSDKAKSKADKADKGDVTVVNNRTSPREPDNDRDKAPKSYASVQWSNWALVLVGGVTGYAVWLQAKHTRIAAEASTRAANAARDSAEAAKANAESAALTVRTMADTAEKDLRAYVCLVASEVRFSLSHVPEVFVCMKNCGRTPAYDLRWWIGTWVGEHPLSISLPDPSPDLRMSTSTLPPGEKPHIMRTVHHGIDPRLLPILGTPQMTLYVYGRVTYKDAFGKERYTNYRLIYNSREGLKPKNGGGMTSLMKPDSAGNDAD